MCLSPAKKWPFDETGENDEFAFYPLKTRASLLRPLKTTKMTKMAGVTQAKAWFGKSRVCSSLMMVILWPDCQPQTPSPTRPDTPTSRPWRSRFWVDFGRRPHPSRDVVFFGQMSARKRPEIISVHDVWEPLKQVLLASRDVIISSQICGSNVQRFFTLGDGCWLPNFGCLWPKLAEKGRKRPKKAENRPELNF